MSQTVGWALAAIGIVALGDAGLEPRAMSHGPDTLLAGPGQQATFSARRESVRVDVLVTDGGRIVRGLRADDFEIRDDGVPQTVDVVSFEQLPVQIFLALDLSYSVSGDRLRDLLTAGHALLDALRPDDRVSLVTFNHAVSRRSAPTSNLAELRATLDTVRPAEVDSMGGTALIDAVYAALVAEEAAGERVLALVFSDGVDTGSWLTSARAIDIAKRSNVVVDGVSVRGPGSPAFLEEVSAVSGGTMVEVESTRNLRAIFVRALEEFRGRYLLSYSPTGVATQGWHRLDVRIKGRRATVKSRTGYIAD